MNLKDISCCCNFDILLYINRKCVSQGEKLCTKCNTYFDMLNVGGCHVCLSPSITHNSDKACHRDDKYPISSILTFKIFEGGVALLNLIKFTPF